MIYLRNEILFVMRLLLCAIVAMSSSVYAEQAPQFVLPSDSGEVRLSDLHSKVVYLDFWASWCAPCRKSFPWFDEIQARYKDQGLVVIAVNMDKDKMEASKFLKKYPANFIITYDPEGTVADKYNVVGMPSSYLIDRNGDIYLSHLGFREKDKSSLESSLKTLLAQ
jgi:thiol-disulfide isomerase/thioredoxin